MTRDGDERLIGVGGEPAGVLGRDAAGRYVFAYDRRCAPDAFVSLTMPVRLQSYVWPSLHPVFEGALPQDATRAALVQLLARAGESSPFALFDRCRHRLGRWHPMPAEATSPPDVDPVAPRAMMTAADARPAYAELYARQYAPPAIAPPPGVRMHQALDADAIYRCDPGDGAEAFNEWCALAIARRAGFAVPALSLSADGRVLRLERYDGVAGARLGVEDLCGLQGLAPDARYGAPAERLVSVAAALAPAVARTALRRELYRRLLLGHLLGDGERHLQSYAVVYGSAEELSLAPLVGVATDWSAPPGDERLQPGLSVGGERRYGLRRGSLRRFGAHCALSERESGAILDWLIAAQDAEARALRAQASPVTLPWLRRLEEYWASGARALKASY